MKKVTLITLLFAATLAIPLLAASEIEIPFGKAITVDGGFTTGEWDDAANISLNLSAGTHIQVYYKHDNKNLYLAYCSNLMSMSSIRCPEVLLDINYDKSTGWSGDDWWFHVSATDCYSKGKYGDYTTCKAIQPDWEANNLIDPGFKDTVEVIIPFATLGLEPKGTVNIGICFVGTDTQTSWEYWPAGANKSNPSGWAKAIFDFSANVIDEENTGSLLIYPNPADDFIHIINPYSEISNIQIYSPDGREVFEGQNIESVDVSSFPTGIYLVRIGTKSGYKTRELAIIR